MFEIRAKENAIETMTLWQAIESVVQLVPFTKAKIERLFSIALSESRRSAHTSFLVGEDVSLANGWHIAKVDLRLGLDVNEPELLILELDGLCTTIEQVKDHYGSLQIAGIPTGRSPSEETSHSKDMPWGRLSFGFADRNPKCLTSVAFAPTKMNK